MKTAQKKTATKSGSAGNASKRQPTQKSKSASKSSDDQATGLRDLLEDGLKDIYWAEKALVKALPALAKKATSEELIDALNEHLAVTQEQVNRLDEVFASLGTKAQAKKCEAMEGLVKEANEMTGSTAGGVVRDAAIIGACQKVEHYEIATYGTLATYARILGETEAADLLEQTLAEEKDADVKLTEVAESSINLQAADQDEEEDEEEEE